MFIKKQDNRMVINLDYIEDIQYSDKHWGELGHWILYRNKVDLFSLGSYETENRCKEVFNEICSAIKDSSIQLYELPKE